MALTRPIVREPNDSATAEAVQLFALRERTVYRDVVRTSQYAPTSGAWAGTKVSGATRTRGGAA